MKKLKPTIWYFADPMCSWCWGFSPVINKIRSEYINSTNISLNLGGLRPGTERVITQQEREEIFHHWHSVQKMTGQTFLFENALPEGFIYDTEPASRLVTLIASLNSDRVFECFHQIQKAFYCEGRDVTSTSVLQSIAVELGVTAENFVVSFESDHIKQATQQHFSAAYQAGVRGFPAIIWQDGDTIEKLSNGYVPFEKLSKDIDKRLNLDNS